MLRMTALQSDSSDLVLRKTAMLSSVKICVLFSFLCALYGENQFLFYNGSDNTCCNKGKGQV